MKKTIILAAMMAVIASASSQTTDTVISFGDRLPYLYYWDTNWVDHYQELHPDAVDYPYDYYYSDLYCGFVGRGCTTSTPLKITGIAGFIKIETHSYGSEIIDTSIEHRLPEYFRLYVAEGDSIRFAAQTRWDTTTPNKSLELRSRNNQRDTFPLHEAYFDKPVIVDSLFFVGGTSFNNYVINVPVILPNSLIIYKPVFTHPFTTYLYTYLPNDAPGIGYDEYLYFGLQYYDERDTLIGIVDTTYRFIGFDRTDWFPTFFAIFDTSYIYNPPDTIECLPPTGLHLDDIDTATATIAWNHQDSTLWQLQVFNADSIPDTSTFIDSLSINMIVLTDLDTGITYAARLRTLCTADTSSGWTDTIQFRLPTPTDDPNDPDDPDDPDDPTGIDSPQNSPIDLYTHLYPNPATTSLTVISSFHLHKIEIFSADGRLILATPAKGVSTTVDISSLAPATYIVRVTTPSGTATKRLVKK